MPRCLLLLCCCAVALFGAVDAISNHRREQSSHASLDESPTIAAAARFAMVGRRPCYGPDLGPANERVDLFKTREILGTTAIHLVGKMERLLLSAKCCELPSGDLEDGACPSDSFQCTTSKTRFGEVFGQKMVNGWVSKTACCKLSENRIYGKTSCKSDYLDCTKDKFKCNEFAAEALEANNRALEEQVAVKATKKAAAVARQAAKEAKAAEDANAKRVAAEKAEADAKIAAEKAEAEAKIDVAEVVLEEGSKLYERDVSSMTLGKAKALMTKFRLPTPREGIARPYKQLQEHFREHSSGSGELLFQCSGDCAARGTVMCQICEITKYEKYTRRTRFKGLGPWPNLGEEVRGLFCTSTKVEDSIAALWDLFPNRCDIMGRSEVKEMELQLVKYRNIYGEAFTDLVQKASGRGQKLTPSAKKAYLSETHDVQTSVALEVRPKYSLGGLIESKAKSAWTSVQSLPWKGMKESLARLIASCFDDDDEFKIYADRLNDNQKRQVKLLILLEVMRFAVEYDSSQGDAETALKLLENSFKLAKLTENLATYGTLILKPGSSKEKLSTKFKKVENEWKRLAANKRAIPVASANGQTDFVRDLEDNLEQALRDKFTNFAEVIEAAGDVTEVLNMARTPIFSAMIELAAIYERIIGIPNSSGSSPSRGRRRSSSNSRSSNSHNSGISDILKKKYAGSDAVKTLYSNSEDIIKKLLGQAKLDDESVRLETINTATHALTKEYEELELKIELMEKHNTLLVSKCFDPVEMRDLNQMDTVAEEVLKGYGICYHQAAFFSVIANLIDPLFQAFPLGSNDHAWARVQFSPTKCSFFDPTWYNDLDHDSKSSYGCAHPLTSRQKWCKNDPTRFNYVFKDADALKKACEKVNEEGADSVNCALEEEISGNTVAKNDKQYADCTVVPDFFKKQE